MPLVCFGVQSPETPLALLEKLTLMREEMLADLPMLSALLGADEMMGLVTCNRVEWYAQLPSGDVNRKRAVECLCIASPRISPNEVEPYMRLLIGADAEQHLFRTAAGLNSMVVGEHEILGQVRRALDLAAEAETLGTELAKVVEHAVEAGRVVRRRTDISTGKLSIPALAVEQALEHLGKLYDRRLLVIGAGQMARLAAELFLERGVGPVLIAARDHQRALPLLGDCHAAFLKLDRLGYGFEWAEIIVVAISGHDPLLPVGRIRRPILRRKGRPLLVIDLSMPHMVDPEIGQLDGVSLINIQSLEGVACENRRRREADIAAAEEIIAEEHAVYTKSRAHEELERLVSAVRQRFDETRQSVLERATTGSASDNGLRMFSESLSRALLHDLTRGLRRLDLETDQGRSDFEAALRLLLPDGTPTPTGRE